MAKRKASNKGGGNNNSKKNGEKLIQLSIVEALGRKTSTVSYSGRAGE
jgi:hypothetical protein